MKIDRTPRLKRQWSVIAHSADVVELRHGVWNPTSFTINDGSQTGVLLEIITALDGNRSLKDIARKAGISVREVEAVVEQLQELDLLEIGPNNAIDYYVEQIVPNLTPLRSAASQRGRPTLLLGSAGVVRDVAAILSCSLPDNVIEVLDDGHQDSHLLGGLGSLANAAFDGLSFEEQAAPYSAWADRMIVYVTETVRPHEALALNRLSLRYGFPWLHATADGPFVLVGPTFVPNRTACYECLETRVLMNLREEASYQAYKRALVEGRVSGATAPLDAVVGALLSSLAAFAALNFLVTATDFTIHKMLAVYLPSMEFTFNEVLRIPGCPACGSSAESDDRELYFDVRSLLNEIF
jgi:bacteriocin biosynthesis cyclodehydratase domain-containing protein